MLDFQTNDLHNSLTEDEQAAQELAEFMDTVHQGIMSDQFAILWKMRDDIVHDRLDVKTITVITDRIKEVDKRKAEIAIWTKQHDYVV